MRGWTYGSSGKGHGSDLGDILVICDTVFGGVANTTFDISVELERNAPWEILMSVRIGI